MASLRKRSSGRWQAQVRVKGYPTQTKSFRTRAAATQWVRSIEYEIDQGLFVSRNEAETTTVAELLNRYLIEYTPKKKGADPEACRIRKLLRHPLAKRFIASIRGLDMARYRDERLQHVSAGSVRRELTILSQLFEISPVCSCGIRSGSDSFMMATSGPAAHPTVPALRAPGGN